VLYENRKYDFYDFCFFRHKNRLVLYMKIMHKPEKKTDANSDDPKIWHR